MVTFWSLCGRPPSSNRGEGNVVSKCFVPIRGEGAGVDGAVGYSEVVAARPSCAAAAFFPKRSRPALLDTMSALGFHAAGKTRDLPKRGDTMEVKKLKGHPLLGHLPDFRSHRLELLRRVAGECGDLGGIRLGPIRVVVVSNAKLAREILTERHQEFSRVPLQGMDGIKRLYGAGMLVADGDAHRAQRKRVAGAFNRQQLRASSEVIARVVEDRQASWADGSELDLTQELAELTRTLARRIIFGIDANSALDRTLAEALAENAVLTLAEMARLLPLPGWVPTPHNFRFRRAIRDVDACVGELVRLRRTEPSGGQDLLATLLRESERGLSDRELRDDLVNLFMAGNEATASALFWAAYHLAREPALADDLREQTRAVVGHEMPSAVHLGKLRLVSDVFRESMRLYPAGHIIVRVAKDDLSLGGATVRKKTLVALNCFMIHRDAKHFERPDVFDPGRFARMSDSELAAAYLPFGAGPRTCIGNHFAMLQGPLTLLVLSRRVRFEPLDAGEVPLATGFAISPGGPFRVRVRRLEADSRSAELAVNAG